MKPKVNYDKKVDILNMKFSDEKSVDSEMQGNLVVDYGKDGDIVNIEVMGFSLENFSKVKEFAHSKQKSLVKS
jgi:uncharacterized protein YuzE